MELLRDERTKRANALIGKFDEVQCAAGAVLAGPTVGGCENVRISKTIRQRCSSVSRFLKDGIGLRPSVSL